MKWRRLGRPAVIALLAMAMLVVPGTSSNAEPTRGNLRTARARLHALNRRLQVIDEAYDQAVITLAGTRRRLRSMQKIAGRAQATWARARRAMSAASVDAYIQGSDSAMAIMSADNVVTLADRLGFIESLTSRNADLALRASVSGRRATRVARQVQVTLASESKTLRSLGSMRAELQRGVAKVESLLRQIQGSEAEGVSRSFARAPLAPGRGAQAALDAAYSVLGTPYRYAGASPSEGFDCSGLTMWAWAHAGVSLPHSAQSQYDSIPHVTRSELAPGDLVFFYHPISHVGMYVGNGRMIEAPHPGDRVKIIGIYWDSYVGAGRPGG